MKVMADTTSGVYAVSSFDDFGGCEVMAPEVFLAALRDLGDETIGSDLGGATAAKIIDEYGITTRPGGASMARVAAATLGRKGGAAKSAAKAKASKANGAKGGRPPKTIQSAIKAAARLSGQLSHGSMSLDDAYPNLDAEQARSQIATLETCGLDGDWGEILGPDWAKELPEALKAEWEALNSEEQDELEQDAISIAKKEEAKLDIAELEEWLKDNE